MTAQTTAKREITDCGNDACMTCDVCKYLSFLEHYEQTAPPGSTVQRDPEIEAYLDRRKADEPLGLKAPQRGKR